MLVKDIYSEIIAENSRATRHKHPLDTVSCELRGVNPSCGDDITMQLKVDDDVITDIAFAGEGCAISQASTTMMIDLVKGKTLPQAQELVQLFLRMLKGEERDEGKLAPLEDSIALQGISHMPARVKCAGLAWHTLLKMIKEEQQKSDK